MQRPEGLQLDVVQKRVRLGLCLVARERDSMDEKIIELAKKYRSLAVEILAEAIRIPADYVDRPVDDGGDPSCGLSNHEQPRLEYLKKKILEAGEIQEKRRPSMPLLSMEDRNTTFKEVQLGFTTEMAMGEAKRCLRCDKG